MTSDEGEPAQVDLVLVAIGGVQRFIAESRTTTDVAGASELMQALARVAGRTAQRGLAGHPEPCGLVFPALGAVDGRFGTTNQIAFLSRAGEGADLARAILDDVNEEWRARVKAVFGEPLPVTPGMPDVAWVRVTGSALPEEYAALWDSARRALVARKRARVFSPLVKRAALCGQAPQLPASPIPKSARKHEKRREEHLSPRAG
jgi:hypothetical protein